MVTLPVFPEFLARLCLPPALRKLHAAYHIQDYSDFPLPLLFAINNRSYIFSAHNVPIIGRAFYSPVGLIGLLKAGLVLILCYLADLPILAFWPNSVLVFIRLRRRPRSCPWLNAQMIACYGVMSPQV
jgi:hypothetical protein